MPTRDPMEKRETHRLIAADKVEGTAVYNAKDEKLGTIDRVMIDKVSGRIAYAVMSFGGFLGIADRHHPLPWTVLRYDTGKGGYIVNLDKRMLEAAPTIAIADVDLDWEDRDWNRRVHDYYKAPLLY